MSMIETITKERREFKSDHIIQKNIKATSKKLLLLSVTQYFDVDLLSFEIPHIDFEINASLKELDIVNTCVSILLSTLDARLKTLKYKNKAQFGSKLKNILKEIVTRDKDFVANIEFIKHINKNKLYEDIEQSLKEVREGHTKSFTNSDDLIESLFDENC